MSAKTSPFIPQALASDTPGTAPAAPDLLLVCLQDPFDGVGDSSSIVHSAVPAADGILTHQWMLESVLEINPPRFFASWATRESFVLNLSVSATALPVEGTWGGTVSTLSGSGNCRVLVMRDATNKVQFSLDSNARHAPEKPMPIPDNLRFLNADIAFEANGKSGLSAGAVAVISGISWSHLIAGSSAATQGLAFDDKWRHNLSEGDGDSMVAGTWAFAVMTLEAYQDICSNNGWVPNIV